MKKKPAPVAPPPTGLSTEQRQAQEAQVGQANTTIANTQTALSPYLPGSSGMSEFRRALTGNLAHSTAVTGDNAIAQSRNRAQAAGFGGHQPITFGAESALANEQAGRIAAIPGQVEAQAAPLELQATGQLANTAGQQIQAANVYNPESYYSAAANAEQQRQNEFANQQEEARKRKAGIWGSLAKVGLSAASAIPGLGRIAGALG